MKIQLSNIPHRLRRSAAFTMVEMMVASTIAVFVLGGFVVFTDLTATSMLGISTQTDMNQDAGLASSAIHSQVRLAIDLTNNASGTQLRLGFDANNLVDSDLDGKTYNDKDFYRLFTVVTGDGDMSTVGDNMLVYQDNATNAGVTNILISSGLRPLPGNTNFFTISNNNSVYVRFGVLDDYESDQSQVIEIQTVAVSRNIKNK